jgi:hypothetical protein
MGYEGISLSAAAARISNLTSVCINLKDYSYKQRVKARAWEIYKQTAEDNMSVVKEYAESRGWRKLPEVGLSLSPHTLQSNGMTAIQLRKSGLTNDFDNEYYFNHLIFPVYDKDSKLVHFNARNLSKDAKTRWMSSAGQPGVDYFFFNSERLYNKTSNYIVLCEGVSDCLSLYQIDVPAIAQFGVNVNLTAHHKAFAEFDGIIAMYDRDKYAAGTEKADLYKSWEPMLPQLIELMSTTKTPIYFLMPPEEEGIKDLNDWLLHINYSFEEYAQYGKDNLRPIVDLAIEVYKERPTMHEYVWRCLASDPTPDRLAGWVKTLESKYEDLTKYILHLYA